MIYENLQVLEIEPPQAPPILPPAFFLCYALSSGPDSPGSSPNLSPLSSVSHNNWAQPVEEKTKQCVCRACVFTFSTSGEPFKFETHGCHYYIICKDQISSLQYVNIMGSSDSPNGSWTRSSRVAPYHYYISPESQVS